MPITGFIPDGYTLRATIPAKASAWQETRILYRPATASEARDHLQLLAVKDEKDWLSEASAFAAKHLKAWNMTTPSGENVAPSAENLRRLSQPLFGRIYGIICGTEDGFESVEADDMGNSPEG